MCHGCKQVGHIKPNCPQRTTDRWGRAPIPQTKAAAHCVQEDYNYLPQETPSGNSENWATLHEVNPVQAAGDNRAHHRQSVKLNGQEARGLRDSGATITLVQPHRVTPTQHTGRTIAVRVAGGAIHKLPTAQVHIDWGTGAKAVEVGIMPDLPAEVLLGNDLGCLTSQLAACSTEGALPVTTRQQSRAMEASPSTHDQMPQCLDWEQY
ncbi:uncharacterized protein O3C94_002792 [Discoglossus pictus]